MSEADHDEQIAQVLLGLMRSRRVLDVETFDNLLGAVLVEIDLGMQIAEEAALEERYRRPAGNVVPFTAGRRRTFPEGQNT